MSRERQRRRFEGDGVPTGRRGRAVRLAVVTPLIAILPLGVIFSREGMRDSEYLVVPAIGVLCVLAWLWIRLPFTGPTVAGDRLTLRTWWSTVEFDRATIAGFHEEEYLGSLTLVIPSWLVSSRLVIELRSGEHVATGGTVSGSRAARDMAAALNQWIGLELGPRRARRRQDPEGGCIS